MKFDEDCHVPHKRVEIHYVLDGFRGGYWSRALTIAPPEDETGLPINVIPDPKDGTTCQRAELHVLWPHPACPPDKARAIIRLWHRGRQCPGKHAGFSPGRAYGKLRGTLDRRKALPEAMVQLAEQKVDPTRPEIFILDFDRCELDLILPDLVCGGFFKKQWRPNGGAHLIVQVNGRRVQKEWTPEPRLDDLLTRVSVDGRRVLDEPADDPLISKPVQQPDMLPPPGRSRFENQGDLPLPPLPDESSGTPKKDADKPKDAAIALPPRPIPLPLEPGRLPVPPEPEESIPPFDDTPADDVLPPPLRPELTR